MAALPEMVVHIHPSEMVLDAYDAGILSDFGGGNVEWWQDYIRAELGRAHEFYQSQIGAHPPATSPGAVRQVGCEDDDGLLLVHDERDTCKVCETATSPGADQIECENCGWSGDASGLMKTANGSRHCPKCETGEWSAIREVEATIPTNAERVEPVYGWAAVAPDGQIQTGMIFHAAIIVRHTVAKLRRQDSRESYGYGWRRAYRAGWRVIRVQIGPAGEREEAAR